MMASSFGANLRRLHDEVGKGDLEGSVTVDQIYAKIQHEAADFNHPRGGQAFYLVTPLHNQMNHYLQHLADHLLDGGLKQAMIDNVEDLSDQLKTYAPVDFNNLRRSGHPIVKDDGRTVYDRAPEQRRLTEQELKQLRHHH